LKVISKQVICREGLEPSVINERAILEQTIFPYIVGFVKAFQDEINLYILMEYIHGKDLFDVIR
jgi:cGMP-dependent protein kinase